MTSKQKAKKKAPRESDKLALEADEMTKKLAELRAAVSGGKEFKPRPGSTLWASAARPGVNSTLPKPTAKKKTTTTSSATTTPRATSSSGTTTTTHDIQPRATSAGATAKCSATTTTSTTTTTTTSTETPTKPRPPSGGAPPDKRNVRTPKDPPPKISPNFSLLSGNLDTTPPTDPELTTLEYMAKAQQEHTENFEEIEQYIYDEEREAVDYYDRVREELKVTEDQLPNTHSTRPTSAGHRRPTTSTSTTATQSQPATTEFATSPIKHNTETTTQSSEVFSSQTEPYQKPWDPRWDAFVVGVQEATKGSYWFHLMNQLVMVEKMKEIQLLQAEDNTNTT